MWHRPTIGSHTVAQDPAGHLRRGPASVATTVIVHGGHADDNDMEAGFERGLRRWTISRPTCRCILENTAGGDHAMARYFDTIGRLGITSATRGLASASTPAMPGPRVKR